MHPLIFAEGDIMSWILYYLFMILPLYGDIDEMDYEWTDAVTSLGITFS